MGLETKLTLSTSDKDGKSVTLIDSTGLYNATTNPGGYGAPNPTVGNISSISIFVEPFGSTKLEHSKVYTTGSVSPSIADITSQVPFVITPALLLSDSSTFSDGVLNITMITALQSLALVGIVGQQTITSAAAFFDTFDGLVIGGEFYYVDQSKANTSSLLYLTKVLVASTIAGIPFYSATSKALVYGKEECCVVRIIGRMADDTCSVSDINFITKMYTYLLASKTSFKLKDYSKANNLIKRVNEICLTLNCGC